MHLHKALVTTVVGCKALITNQCYNNLKHQITRHFDCSDAYYDLLLRAHNDAHKHRVRLATLFVGKMAELFGDAAQIMAPKKDAVSASLTAVLEANGEPVQQISVDIVQSLLQLQQDSASKEFNKAFKMLELAFQLHSDIKSCRDWAEQAACDTYNASYEAICETWPTVLKLKHSLVVIQARFQAIKGGESLEVRNGMLARAKEIQDKDAQESENFGRPFALPTARILSEALAAAAGASQR